MRSCRSLGQATVVLVAIGLVVAVVPSVAGAKRRVDEPAGTWSPPVSGRVVRPFAEPLATYGPGHRGVDFSAPSGTAVRAANDGVVSFAGVVAGSLHVVIAHDGGIRTSSSFLLRIDVRVGQRVRRGDVIGAAGGVGDGHGAGVLHFGVRVGERYVDPMLLFRPRDLTELVRLVPLDQRTGTVSSEDEAALLARWLGQGDPGDGSSCGEIVGAAAGLLGIGDETSSLCDALGEAVETGLQVLHGMGGEAARLAEAIGPVVTEVVRRMRDLGESLADAARAVAAAAAAEVERAVHALVAVAVAAYERLTSCPQPDPVANPVGSGNLVMAVAGRGSRRRTRPGGSAGPSLGLRWGVLGYHAGDVSYFSYAAGSAAYGPRATYGDLHEKARLLGEQIKAAARSQPGRHLDLVGHSQGGVVIDLFLKEVYRGHEAEYPPIDNVVTFASPHEGTPSASVGTAVGRSVVAPALRTASEVGMPGLGLGSDSLAQLAAGSETMRDLWADGGPPRGIRFLSIAGSEDPVVPSSVADVPGARKVVVPVGSAFDPTDDHSGILRDADAISAAQAHLSGGAPVDSCGPLTDVVSTGYVVAAQAAANALAARQPFGSPLTPTLAPPSPFPVLGDAP